MFFFFFFRKLKQSFVDLRSCEAVSPWINSVFVFCVDGRSSRSIKDGPVWHTVTGGDGTPQRGYDFNWSAKNNNIELV